MSAQWYQLGLQLKLKIGTLDPLRVQFSDPKDQLMEMLKTWLTTSDNTTWKTLTNALRSQSVGASRLAGDLEEKYCLMPEGTKVDRGVSASDSDPETYVTPPSEPVDRGVSASDSDSESYATPPSEPVVGLPTSQPGMADMQDLESKFFHSTTHETSTN